MTRRKKRKALFWVLSVCLLAPSCGSKRAPSPMSGETIFYASELKMAVFDFGTGLDRSRLEECSREFPSVEILGEDGVHRALRAAGLTPNTLLAWGEDFESFRQLKGLHLLLLVFPRDNRTYLRTVNYLGRYVTTVVLDVARPGCEDIFRAQRVVSIESHPPYADIQLDGRGIGESPLWAWLRDGTYEIQCRSPGEKFRPVKLQIPKDVRVQCLRENVKSDTRAAEDEPMTAGEKTGSVLVFLVGAIAAVAAILIPLLFLL
jgi:hypothetical protein